MGWTPVILTIFLIAVAIYRRSKDIIIEWGPFVVLWMVYDNMRGLADEFSSINIKPVYDLELKLFGWLFGGEVPPFWFQSHKNAVLDVFFSMFYAFHIAFPIALAVYMIKVSKDKEAFREMAYTYVITTYTALVTFFLYPVAPPWYVWNDGNGYRFDQPGADWDAYSYESGKLFSTFDEITKSNLFYQFYGQFNANPFAAFPSLHTAYSFLVAFFAIKCYGRKAIWVALYPLGVWIAAVYLNHHYIVDLLGGVLYALFAVYLANKLLAWKDRRKNSQDDIEELESMGD